MEREQRSLGSQHGRERKSEHASNPLLPVVRTMRKLPRGSDVLLGISTALQNSATAVDEVDLAEISATFG